jgi:hypothetical protein
MNTTHQVLRENLGRYLKASKADKGKMLDEWVPSLQMHRKAIIRFLKRRQMTDSRIAPKRRGRKEKYGPAVTAALKVVWEASSQLCGERLHAILSDYVGIFQRDSMWHHANDTTALLLAMSLATMKRRVGKFQSAQRVQRQSTTKASHLIIQIPVRTGPWDNPEPGFGEIDTVVHCGSTLAGDMAYTVNYTDIATTWWEGAAQMNKGAGRTVQSITGIKDRLPFPLQGLDPDNGSEFINWNLKEWCDNQTPTIELTRSRPYKKNDNAHIEQKNGAITRQFIGYRRIDTPEQVELLNQLYAGSLRLYINFFQPSMKLQGKTRVGSRYKRSYDIPKSPYKRILELDSIDQDTKDQLTALYETLNPLKLKHEIDILIHKIFAKK